MQRSGLIAKTRKSAGKMSITVYICTPEGLNFCRNILEPYEKIFPRQKIYSMTGLGSHTLKNYKNDRVCSSHGVIPQVKVLSKLLATFYP
jgi:hypothetical protein